MSVEGWVRHTKASVLFRQSATRTLFVCGWQQCLLLYSEQAAAVRAAVGITHTHTQSGGGGWEKQTERSERTKLWWRDARSRWHLSVCVGHAVTVTPEQLQTVRTLKSSRRRFLRTTDDPIRLRIVSPHTFAFECRGKKTNVFETNCKFPVRSRGKDHVALDRNLRSSFVLMNRLISITGCLIYHRGAEVTLVVWLRAVKSSCVSDGVCYDTWFTLHLGLKVASGGFLETNQSRT